MQSLHNVRSSIEEGVTYLLVLVMSLSYLKTHCGLQVPGALPSTMPPCNIHCNCGLSVNHNFLGCLPRVICMPIDLMSI
jgi:hypothetical protein